MIEFIQNKHFNHLFHYFKNFLRKKVERYTQKIVIFSQNLGKKHHKKYPVSGTSEYRIRIRIPHIWPDPDPDIRSIPTRPLENGHNSRKNDRRALILYIFEIPEERGIRIWSQISIWNVAKKVDFFEFGAKKFAYIKISKKCQIKVGISQRNNFCTESILIQSR